ncbi:MAG: response regulator [Wenzhouxiangella sp.]|nr:MAG: response regulator [Wenzhouxiangella sp.]
MNDLNRVLYVEDDPDIQAVAVMALEAVAGLTVQACDSGAEALAVALEFAPDLIVLDVMMPGMDGPTTLARLRELPTLADTPVVFVTAKTEAAEVERFLGLGALAVITKPFDPMQLGAQLRSIWQHDQAGRGQ